MSHPLHVAFIWHQHQPLYKSRELDGNTWQKYRLPWVRLHGTKDYLDLVLMLERYPQLHQTVNLVPSLILQLEDYAQGKAIDPYLALTLTPEAQLTIANKQFIIQHFFDGYSQTLIAPHPRYADLYSQRQERGVAWCLEHWNAQDYSDLLAWHNLAWIDPLFWEDAEVAQWLKQGKNFSLSDRQRIYSKQKQIISRIVPQHRKMQEQGQLEIMTSPYSHAILPLLADTNSARIAIPQMSLPNRPFQWSEDVTRQLNIAREIYQDRFAREPWGLWCSEQAVSPSILPQIAEQGFKWICSDEMILAQSFSHLCQRDEVGQVYQPEILYRPYRLTTSTGDLAEDLAIVFRDRHLSDLIASGYSNMSPQVAATDFNDRLTAIAERLQSQSPTNPTTPEQPWLVTIALDGQNCWEYYPQDGMPFLDNLYAQLSQNPQLKLVTVKEFIQQFPPIATIPSHQLHSGSWVDGSFSTWIGNPAQNRAWELLAEARTVLAQHPEASEANNPEAWEALYAAESSDWFCWLGTGNASSHNDVFDQLFRGHLAGIYQALNEPIPQNLTRPLTPQPVTQNASSSSFIHPAIDGLGKKSDWQLANHLETTAGTMHRSSMVQQIYSGIDLHHLYLRFDFLSTLELDQDLPGELHLLWYYPQIPRHHSPAPLAYLPDVAPVNYYFHHHLGINLTSQSAWLQEAQANGLWRSRLFQGKVALKQCLEIAIPWVDLKVKPNYSLAIIAILAEQGEYRAHIPENQQLTVKVP